MRASFNILGVIVWVQLITEFRRGWVDPSEAEPGPSVVPLQMGHPLNVGTRTLACDQRPEIRSFCERL